MKMYAYSLASGSYHDIDASIKEERKVDFWKLMRSLGAVYESKEQSLTECVKEHEKLEKEHPDWIFEIVDSNNNPVEIYESCSGIENIPNAYKGLFYIAREAQKCTL